MRNIEKFRREIDMLSQEKDRFILPLPPNCEDYKAQIEEILKEKGLVLVEILGYIYDYPQYGIVHRKGK